MSRARCSTSAAAPAFLARNLAPRVDRVDAVDLSPRMVEEGKRLPGGNHSNLRWIVGAVEDAQLDPPYALVTAGQSIHWMDWDVLLPRLHKCLSPRGALALVGISIARQPWARRTVRGDHPALLDQQGLRAI
ncbi:MAG: class I SAM-dependent methyltransferase [Caldilineaceae bacterium]|nr:class I SAM-dependent methyltransferase [Caldilineaceae bacterium]